MAQQTFEEWFDENSSRLVWVLELKEALEALKEAYQLGLEQQQQQQSQWQPIDTAPKDGIVIQGYQKISDDTWVIAPMYYLDGKWYLLAYHSENTEFEMKPTHWQPIPVPPAN